MTRLLASHIFEPGLGYHYAAVRFHRLSTLPHCHDFHEFFLTLEGVICHQVNGKQQVLPAGTIVWIRPDDVHYFHTHLCSEQAQIINVALPSELVQSLFAYLSPHSSVSHLLTADQPPASRLSAAEVDNLRRKLDRLAMAPSNAQSDSLVELKSLLTTMIPRYWAVNTMPDAMPDWLGELLVHMQRKEHFALGLTQLHNFSGKNPEYTARCFRKHLGATPTQWLNRIRLEHAAKLLTYTDEAIIDIAMDCGFHNLSHFYHLFAERFACTPAKYRRQEQDLHGLSPQPRQESY